MWFILAFHLSSITSLSNSEKSLSYHHPLCNPRNVLCRFGIFVVVFPKLVLNSWIKWSSIAHHISRWNYKYAPPCFMFILHWGPGPSALGAGIRNVAIFSPCFSRFLTQNLVRNHIRMQRLSWAWWCRLIIPAVWESRSFAKPRSA